MQHVGADHSRGGAQWGKCPRCEAFLYSKRLARNLEVCPECSHHFRLSAAHRIAQLLDANSFEEMGDDIEATDILSFVDRKPYAVRLQDSRLRTGLGDAAVFGTAAIGGMPLVVVVMDFAFMGGSMGSAVGEVVTRAAELALETRLPLLLVACSGGARMQEGCVSLMQLAKTTQAIARLHEEGILCICLNTDPTFGGVTASFAMLGDVIIGERGSLIGFAGPKVIAQTIGKDLPEGFQTAEFLLDHGMLDIVESRENLRNMIGRVLRLHGGQRGASPGAAPGEAFVTNPRRLRRRPAWDTVQVARHAGRPTTLDYVDHIFDEFQELRGDRLFGDSPAIVGGPARVGDLSVMVIGHQKGETTAERISRNFGMAQPEGYRKAARLMRHAAKFGMPVVTFVDTPGAYPGVEAESRGQGAAVAQSIMEMSRLPVPVVVVVTGEGGSGGALALGVGDTVLMLENAYYSVISPEGCAVILWGCTEEAPTAANALKMTGRDLLELGIIDGVVVEPRGGAHNDPALTAKRVKEAILVALSDLLPLAPAEILDQRYDRFRKFGTPADASFVGRIEAG